MRDSSSKILSLCNPNPFLFSQIGKLKISHSSPTIEKSENRYSYSVSPAFCNFSGDLPFPVAFTTSSITRLLSICIGIVYVCFWNCLWLFKLSPLLHHLRQLVAKRKHEMLFIFGKKPLRFFMQEFHAVTWLKSKDDFDSDLEDWIYEEGFWSDVLRNHERFG